MIVQELYDIQARHGYLPREELVALADRLALPLYRIQEVVSFFPHYQTKPPPRCEIHVCRDMACALRGSGEITKQLQAALGSNAEVLVKPVSCLGRCDRAPAVRVSSNEAADGHTGHASGDGHAANTILGRDIEETLALARDLAKPHVANRSDHHDSDHDYPATDPNQWRINVYANKPESERYESIRRFIAASGDESGYEAECSRIVQELEAAGLIGMGGAGGRTYKKWSEVRKAQGESKYVVCNGDESEPGTFKDRELLLRTPYLVLEGVILAGLFLRASRGYIYIRHEYEEQIALMRQEIEQATRLGLCGENILGSGRSFAVEVFVSPGGYICGEQTALVEAIEDRRAEPRNRPPELQTNGLHDMPTLLNNVETLGWVPSIVLRDGAWYAQQAARPDSRGARFFSVSGDVMRPGVYEVPVGITLGTLIDDYCGGMRAGEQLKAAALSGPSGGFVPAQIPLTSFPKSARDRLPSSDGFVNLRDLELDVPLFRKWNLMLGGGMVIYGSSADLVEQAVVCQEFYRNESCGKCVPCRIGSSRFAELASAIQAGECTESAIESMQGSEGVIAELGATMRQTAICGLGTVAANPLSSLLTYFRDEIRPHLRASS